MKTKLECRNSTIRILLTSALLAAGLAVVPELAAAGPRHGNLAPSERGAEGNLIGRAVGNPLGEDLGTIDDVVVIYDRAGERVAYAVLAVPSRTQTPKRFVIPVAAFGAGDDGRLQLSVTAHFFARAEGFGANAWPPMTDRDWAARVHHRYGLTPYWQDANESSLAPPRVESSHDAVPNETPATGGLRAPAGLELRREP